MGPPTVMGYNHNLRYKHRLFHLQTELSVQSSHIHSHLFFEGVVIGQTISAYQEDLFESDPKETLKKQMRSQHKSMMRKLLKGELDQQIINLLGNLEPEPLSPRIKIYQHQLSYKGRIYSVETRFHKSVVSEIFCEEIFITSQRQDPSDTPHLEVIKTLAQQQHKDMLRQLRDGHFDEIISQLLGSVEPSRKKPAVTETSIVALVSALLADKSPQPSADNHLDTYHHRIEYKGRIYDIKTMVCNRKPPYSQTSLYYQDVLLTSRQTNGVMDYQKLRKQGQEMHKQILRELRDGSMDETLELLEELESLEKEGER